MVSRQVDPRKRFPMEVLGRYAHDECIAEKEASATSTDRQSLLPKTPAHQAVYTKMRDAVLFGDLAPASRSRFRG